MKCQGCENKCKNVHCAFSFNIVEASQSGKPFKRVDGNIVLICENDGFFKYLIKVEDGTVYNPTQDDFLAEYTLDI